jgi:hypothetical protein
MKILRTILIPTVGLLLWRNVSAGEIVGLATNAPARIELRDQFDSLQKLSFPATNATLLTIADKKGSVQVDSWIAALKPRYSGRIAIAGLADVGGAPTFFHTRIRNAFQESRRYPVMLDWSGKICAQLGYTKDEANILIIDRKGLIQARFTGIATTAAVADVSAVLNRLLSEDPKLEP